MNNKQIKQVEFILENCESIIVPYECFKKFNLIEDRKHKDKIYIFECVIEDNGQITYSMTWDNNITPPIHRLNQHNDITLVNIVYNDNTTKKLSVYWNNRDNYNSNKNQTTKLINFKTIKIQIRPYIEEYTINEIFKFPVGTKFKCSNGEIYEIKKNQNGKFIEGLLLEERFITMKYRKVKNN